MKKLLSLLAAVGVVFALSSCGDDDDGGSPSGGLSITGIPAAATIKQGDVLTVPDVVVLAEDGILSFTVTVDGGTAIDLTGLVTAGGTAAETITIEFPTADLSLGLRTLVFTLTDTQGDEVTVQHGLTVNPFGTVQVVSNVSEDTTWESDNIYILGGRITVVSGATLTIEAGTIIKGEAGSGANATALLVARGGTLNASGTASAPIIFTSVADEITPEDIEAGDYASPNLEPDVNGLWGGLIILGNAPITASALDGSENNLSEVNIEGIPASDTNGLYGGSDAEDNSGTIRYISVRHGGANIGSGNEINGITLGGVGSGTTIEWVEVVANQDDGIEWFGGDVDIANAVVWNAGDDALDTDQDWNGTCSNFIVVTPIGSAFELDGPEGSRTRGEVHTFTNGVVYAGEDIDHLVDMDGGSEGTNAQLTDIYFYGIEADYGFVLDEDPGEEGNQEFYPVEDIEGNGAGASGNWEYTLLEGSEPVEDIFFEVPSEELTEVEENANTVGPNATGFEWTFAGDSGALGSIGL